MFAAIQFGQPSSNKKRPENKIQNTNVTVQRQFEQKSDISPDIQRN